MLTLPYLKTDIVALSICIKNEKTGNDRDIFADDNREKDHDKRKEIKKIEFDCFAALRGLSLDLELETHCKPYKKNPCTRNWLEC